MYRCVCVYIYICKNHYHLLVFILAKIYIIEKWEYWGNFINGEIKPDEQLA